MFYEPTNWKDGDLVTAKKLNKLEQGVANSSVMMVTLDENTGLLDKTYNEIVNAASNGTIVYLIEPNLSMPTLRHFGHLTLTNFSGGFGSVIFTMGTNELEFDVSAEDGYPELYVAPS